MRKFLVPLFLVPLIIVAVPAIAQVFMQARSAAAPMPETGRYLPANRPPFTPPSLFRFSPFSANLLRSFVALPAAIINWLPFRCRRFMFSDIE